jgi:hypothetical protein
MVNYSIIRILHKIIVLDNVILKNSYFLQGSYDFKLWLLEAVMFYFNQ